MPLTLDSHRVIVGDQQVTRESEKRSRPESADGNLDNGGALSYNNFVSFSQVGYGNHPLSESQFVDDSDLCVLTEAIGLGLWGVSPELFSCYFRESSYLGDANFLIFTGNTWWRFANVTGAMLAVSISHGVNLNGALSAESTSATGAIDVITSVRSHDKVSAVGTVSGTLRDLVFLPAFIGELSL